MEHVIQTIDPLGFLTRRGMIFYGTGWQNTMWVNMEHVIRSIDPLGFLTRRGMIFYRTGWQKTMWVNMEHVIRTIDPLGFLTRCSTDDDCKSARQLWALKETIKP